MLLPCASLSVLPGGVRQRVVALYMDGAELLEGALVAGGRARVGQRSVPLDAAAATGVRRALIAGYGRAAGRAGLKSRL